MVLAAGGKGGGGFWWSIPFPTKVVPKMCKISRFSNEDLTFLFFHLTSLLNLKKNGNSSNFPLYAISLFPLLCLR
jgi:hypothetical protein